MLKPDTQFESRLTQLDIRLTKTIRWGRASIKGMVDAYNVLNGTAVLGNTITYGGSYLKPSAVLGARLFKFGTQIEF